jgi:hypothetical protein
VGAVSGFGLGHWDSPVPCDPTECDWNQVGDRRRPHSSS